MTRSYPSGLCALSGGKRRAGRVSHSVDLGTTVVVVRNVEAKVCDQCGSVVNIDTLWRRSPRPWAW